MSAISIYNNERFLKTIIRHTLGSVFKHSKYTFFSKGAARNAMGFIYQI